MDWCGSVGEVNELFRSEFIIGCHWVVPKIFSMPDRAGHVFYSPTFRFMNTTWYFGIYRYSRVGEEEWIGVEIFRSTDHPLKPAHFSIGVMHSNQSEYLIRRNETFPPKDKVCCINEFLPMSGLLTFKDKLTRSDVLTITCVIWPGVPLLEESNEFWHSDEIVNSRSEASANTRADRTDSESSSTVKRNDEPELATEVKSCEVEETITAEYLSILPRDGTVQEISRVVEWKVLLPPSKTTWYRYSPEFNCGGINLHFSLYSNKVISYNFNLGFTTDVIPTDGNIPPRISWRMAVKNKDNDRLLWILNGQIDTRKEHYQHAPEIRMEEDKLESFISSDRTLTLVYHYRAGEVHEGKEVSTQTDNTGVSWETQPEDKPSGTVELKEFEELSRFSLSDPGEGHRISFIRKEPLEPSIEKYLSQLPRSDEKCFMFVA